MTTIDEILPELTRLTAVNRTYVMVSSEVLKNTIAALIDARRILQLINSDDDSIYAAKLTPTEYAIWKLLSDNAGKIVSTDAIREFIHQRTLHQLSSETLWVHIHRLRDKLVKINPLEKVKTVSKHGYILIYE